MRHRARKWILLAPIGLGSIVAEPVQRQIHSLVGGNEWTRNNTIDPKNVIGKVTTGFHYVRPSWGLHFTLTFSTDSVDPASVRQGVDSNDDFGTLAFDWQF